MSNPNRGCIISPTSKRAIKVGGRTYINLLKKGKIRGTIAERHRYLTSSSARKRGDRMRAKGAKRKPIRPSGRRSNVLSKKSARANQPLRSNTFQGRRVSAPASGKKRLAPSPGKRRLAPNLR